MKVVYLATAERRFAEALRYLVEERGPVKAEALLREIHQRILELEQYPRLGQVEELLDHMGFQHRRLVIGHYKAIYRIEGELILITDIFDSRRDPSEMLGGS